MHALLTWPTNGAWLPGPARGWIEGRWGPPDAVVPVPDQRLSVHRRRDCPWPPVRLDADQRSVVVEDLRRIAALRDFEIVAVRVHEDHVHLLFRVDDERDVHRLVQLVKGALSRALTVAAGDRPARRRGGGTAAHHKWWTRQYSLRNVGDAAEAERMRRLLMADA